MNPHTKKDFGCFFFFPAFIRKLMIHKTTFSIRTGKKNDWIEMKVFKINCWYEQKKASEH